MSLLAGKTALITGASRGIGKEIALLYLQHGASVFYIDLEDGGSLPEYQEIAKKHNAKVGFVTANVSKEEDVQQAVKEVYEKAETVDVLVNNAGITRDNLLFRMTADEWNSVIQVNLSSVFFLSKEIGRRMIRQKSGAIINIASIVGIIGNGGQVNYSSSKAGVIGFTKSMAREVASRNVRVNAIAPGFIRTKMTDKLTDEQRTALTMNIPLGRIGDPEEVAKVALFLASDLASYLTGQVIHATGGLGM